MSRAAWSACAPPAFATLLLALAAVTWPSPVVAADGQWTRLPLAASPPSGRSAFGSVYDPVRKRMIVIGGLPLSSSGVWALSLSGPREWVELSPTGASPPPRWGHTAVYDPTRDQVVVFGGFDGNETNETWILSLASGPEWSLASTNGTPPSGRRHHTSIVDPKNDRIIVFGGYDGSRYRGDVWELALETMTWNELEPEGDPPGGRRLIGIYDPGKKRMVLYSGASDRDVQGVWELSLKKKPKWIRIHESEGPLYAPRPNRRKRRNMSPGVRSDYAAAYDPIGKRLLLFGGSNELADVWAFELDKKTGWSELVTRGSLPSPRAAGGAVFDPDRNEFVLFGGYESRWLNDVHTLSMRSLKWESMPAAPASRSDFTTFLDPVNDRVIYFGGGSSVGNIRELWALSLDGTPEWTLLNDGGQPGDRHGASGAWDPISGDLVLFGGYDSDHRNQLWRFNEADRWDQVRFERNAMQPTPRTHSSMVYDPGRDRFVLFGGAPAYLDDVWLLSLRPVPTWTLRSAWGAPPLPRWGHAAIMDQANDRMLVFGGMTRGGETNDVGALSFENNPPHWTQLSTTGTPPPPLRNMGAAFDATRNRLVVFGGFDGTQCRNETYALSLATLEWTQLQLAGGLPAPRQGTSLIYDAARDRYILFGGLGASGNMGDVWTLTGLAAARMQPVPVAQTRDEPSQLLLRVQNPARNGRLILSLEFPGSGDATVDLIDVGGRRVLSRHLTDVRSGTRQLELDARVSPGVYFVRVAHDAMVRSTRVVMIR